MLLTHLQGLCERCVAFIGRCMTWLSLVMMACLTLVVLLRYGFSMNLIPLQELVIYCHATVFMLGIAYTLQTDGHVRVDIFYRRFNRRQQAWVNSLGTLVFLLPLCVFIFLVSGDFVLQSWQVRESSAEPGGLPGLFLLKSLIPAMALLLTVQGVAELIRHGSVLVLSTAEESADD